MGSRISMEGFNGSWVGLIKVPTIAEDAMPAICFDFSDICMLESSKTYGLAFSMYEKRFASCGLHGWTLDGSGSGVDASVGFLTTPCGMRVAIKGTRKERVLENIQRDCAALKALGEGNANASCPGCFPR